jgi:hypothetical protein
MNRRATLFQADDAPRVRFEATTYRIVAFAERLHAAQKNVSPYWVVTRLNPTGILSRPSPGRLSGCDKLATPTDAQSGHRRISVQCSNAVMPPTCAAHYEDFKNRFHLRPKETAPASGESWDRSGSGGSAAASAPDYCKGRDRRWFQSQRGQFHSAVSEIGQQLRPSAADGCARVMTPAAPMPVMYWLATEALGATVLLIVPASFFEDQTLLVASVHVAVKPAADAEGAARLR